MRVIEVWDRDQAEAFAEKVIAARAAIGIAPVRPQIQYMEVHKIAQEVGAPPDASGNAAIAVRAHAGNPHEMHGFPGSTAYRIRTGVTAVRGRRPRPLDECGTKCPSRRREV